MRAMAFSRVGQPLALEEREVPEPGAGEVPIRISACGVCRTDLHIVDGELSRPRLPLVPAALRAVAPGGIVVCAGIHMSDIPSFAYELLWQERRVVSVANLTRDDGAAFLPLAAEIPIRPAVRTMPLEEANAAPEPLDAAVSGAVVLVP